MSKTSMHVQVNVTRNCLLEFLDILDQNNCHDICVTYSDYGWHVQYDSPFTRDTEVKADASKEQQFPLKVGTDRTPMDYDFCKNCSGLEGCLHRAADKQWRPCQTLDAILADKAQDIGG